MVNVHVCNNGISSIHGKELLGHLSFHHEYKTHVTLKQMFDICKIVSEQDEISGVWSGKLVGKNIHGNICLSLVMKESSIFNARKSTSFRILCCVMGRSCKILNLTKHGSKDWDGWHLLQNTEIWQNRRRANGIVVEHLPRIRYVAALW